MKRSLIEFRKQRDFSDILTDTFGFIRNDYKPFLKTIFKIAGPAIVVFMLSLAVYNYVVGDLFDFSALGQPRFAGGNVFVIVLALLFYILAGVASYILATASALFYIKSYIENKGEVNFEDVKRQTYQNFWPFFGMSFLKGITLGVAILLCFLPVLYAMIPMAVVFSIYVFEPRSSATDAYSQSFTLVNADFWTAFGSFIVLGIIYYVLGMVVSIPTVLYTLLDSGIFSGEVDPSDMNSFAADPVIIFLNVLNTFFQFLLNVILVVGSAVIYFHLHEKVNFTGTYDRISEIGKTED